MYCAFYPGHPRMILAAQRNGTDRTERPYPGFPDFHPDSHPRGLQGLVMITRSGGRGFPRAIPGDVLRAGEAGDPPARARISSDGLHSISSCTESRSGNLMA